jgi:hypothetical protein
MNEVSENQIIVDCYVCEDDPNLWCIQGHLVAGGVSMMFTDGLVDTTEHFDVYVDYMRTMAESLGIPLVIEKDALEIRQELEEEEKVDPDANSWQIL